MPTLRLNKEKCKLHHSHASSSEWYVSSSVFMKTLYSAPIIVKFYITSFNRDFTIKDTFIIR